MVEEPATTRCANCKHWKHPREDFHAVVTWTWVDDEAQTDANRDAANAADTRYGECEAVHFGSVETPTEHLPLAVVKDGSDYFAALYTLPQFGCTNWTASEDGNV